MELRSRRERESDRREEKREEREGGHSDRD